MFYSIPCLVFHRRINNYVVVSYKHMIEHIILYLYLYICIRLSKTKTLESAKTQPTQNDARASWPPSTFAADPGSFHCCDHLF